MFNVMFTLSNGEIRWVTSRGKVANIDPHHTQILQQMAFKYGYARETMQFGGIVFGPLEMFENNVDYEDVVMVVKVTVHSV